MGSSQGSGNVRPCPQMRHINLKGADPTIHGTVADLQGYTLEYLTDVEGNWEYFVRFVELSRILEWDDVEQGVYGPGRLQLKPEGMLVFGGDACDKGPGDIRFVRTLLDLRCRYPGQVFIILGNRDINKLRFYAELQPGAAPLDTLPWDRNSKSLAEWCKEHQVQDTPVNRLRWMLDFMGCQKTTFKTRKRELALLSATRTATDEDVFKSFRESVDPNGKDPWMLTLLRVGQLALVLGDTLFVHAGFHEGAMEKVPGRLNVDGCRNDIKQWVQDLNSWKDAQLDDFVEQAEWRKDSKGGRKRGAEDLILYGTPGYPENATVVYFNPFKDGNPQPLAPIVEDYLQKNGIKRVMSGHQPHGQSPTVVRHPRSGLLTITADTSYSHLTAEKIFNEANCRGSVVSIVRLEGDWLDIEGTLADGTKHSCRLHTDDEQCEMPDRLVGRQQNDGSWIKTILDGDRDLVQAVIGKGPPRFELITQTLSCSMAHFNLNANHRFAESVPDLIPADLLMRQDSFDYNLSAYSGEREVEEQVFSPTPRQPCIKHDFCFNKDEFDKADTYVFSWLGVVENLTAGPEMEKKTVAKINELLRHGKRVIFVSNISYWSHDEFADKVVNKGINMTKETALKNVLNTAHTAAWLLKKNNRQKPFVICSEKGLLDELRAAGITQYTATICDDGTEKEEFLGKATAENVMKLIKENDGVDSVVVGWDQHLTVLKVAVASNYIGWNCTEQPPQLTSFGSSVNFGDNQGVLVVTCSSDCNGILGISPETYLPEKNFNGKPIMTPGNGSMAGLLAVQDTNQVSRGNLGVAFDVGKPSLIMIKALEEQCGVEMQTAVVIGDSLETDIEWAVKGGMKSLLVLSGRTTAQMAKRMEAETYEGAIPTWVLNSLADF